MKTSFTTKAAAALALMMVSSASMAAIANTRHNLGSTNSVTSMSAQTNFASGTTEICVFCHTPHGADSAAAVPLWNRNMNTSGVYTTYGSLGSASLDTAQAPIGSVSLACLSCHDGTQAINVVINSPGSGTTGNVNNGTNDPRNVASGTMSEFNYMSQVTNNAGHPGPAGEMIFLDTDLRNDHPISIQYAGATNVGGAGRAALDPDFKAAQQTSVNGKAFWFVDSAGFTNPDTNALTAGTTGTYQKSDFKLYTRNETSSIILGGAAGTGLSAGNQPFVECATCHDPHVEAKTFLRMGTNKGSQVCLTCHTK